MGEINAGSSARNATGADFNTSWPHLSAFAHLLARCRRQTARSPETYDMKPTTSNRQPSSHVPEMWPISRPPQRTPTIQTVDVSAGREMERNAAKTNDGEIGWLDYICFCVCCDRDDRPDSDSDSDS
ncbi:hypothetical protein BV22DRAFT_932738 [Leucogyrophana mollusca]|uniref:Uncharacterized protein n=1 Tax=Leucogyrophana mollusca TaxID=85980 RepID=A0ACB8AWN5_9AGAM|nr:hypothetical protein BV22DRAFT_932738 [Leucogyrophana mollusca]